MSKPTKGPEPIEMKDGPGQIVGYANLISIITTPEEVILHFGERSMEGPNKGIGIAKIYISLPHAKRLAGALIRTLKNHEEIFGEINADPTKQLTPEALKRLAIKTRITKDG